MSSGRERGHRAVSAAALIVALAIALPGCGHEAGHEPGGAGGDSAVEPVAEVRLGALETRSFADEVVASGQWRSAGELVIAAPFDGVVDSVAVRPGDRVSGGATLAVMLTNESDAAERGAEVMLREARDPAARAEAERALALARREVVRVPIAAARAGLVSRRAVEPGTRVTQSAELLRLVPASELVFEARVPASAAARLHPGQSATVVESAHAPRTARVERVLPNAGSGDQSTLCWLARDDQAEVPDLDRFGTARITLGPPRRAVGVRDSAVVEDDLTGTTRIARVGADGRLQWLTVTLGPPDQGWRELRPPSPDLPVGTRVVIEGQRGLADGVRVHAVP